MSRIRFTFSTECFICRYEIDDFVTAEKIISTECADWPQMQFQFACAYAMLDRLIDQSLFDRIRRRAFALVFEVSLKFAACFKSIMKLHNTNNEVTHQMRLKLGNRLLKTWEAFENLFAGSELIVRGKLKQANCCSNRAEVNEVLSYVTFWELR